MIFLRYLGLHFTEKGKRYIPKRYQCDEYLGLSRIYIGDIIEMVEELSLQHSVGPPQQPWRLVETLMESNAKVRRKSIELSAIRD